MHLSNLGPISCLSHLESPQDALLGAAAVADCLMAGILFVSIVSSLRARHRCGVAVVADGLMVTISFVY